MRSWGCVMRTTTLKAVARGSTAKATMQFVSIRFGAAALDRIVSRLDPELADRLLRSGMTDELQYEDLVALWHSADSELGREHAEWAEDAGAYAIESLGQRLYRGLLQKSLPMEFVTQSVSMFRLYYSPGDIILVDVADGRAVVRLVGFQPVDSLFCRRQTGGLRRAIELAGGKSVSALHVRCEHEGDCYCEWELCWT